WSTSKTPSYTKSVSWQHHLDKDYPILKKARTTVRACLFICWKISGNAMAQQKIKSVTIKAYNPRRITYRK
ncbi:hypothetical protein, partial [Escherichia coli]|uniref:hypothetical protein n=1 Tax=Escherichia coli TaxID=562 RepID=UPI0022E66DF3